jgi:hypothetical protein
MMADRLESCQLVPALRFRFNPQCPKKVGSTVGLNRNGITGAGRRARLVDFGARRSTY